MVSPNKAAFIRHSLFNLYVGNALGRFDVLTAIFTLFLLANTLSMFEIFILQAYFTLLIFVFEVPSGVVADLFGLKRTLIAATLCGIAALIIYGASSTLGWFIIAETFAALSVALVSGTDSALVYDSLKMIQEEHTYKKVMGSFSMMSTVSQGTAAAIGGILASLIGFRALFFVFALLKFIALFFLAKVREPRHYKKVGDTQFFTHLREGAAYAWTHPTISRYIIYSGIVSSLVSMIVTLNQPYFEQGGLSYSLIGLAVGGSFIVSALGYFFVHRLEKRWKNDNLQLIIILGIIASCFVLAGIVPVIIGLGLLYIIHFSSSVSDIVTSHAIHTHTPSSHRATIISVGNSGGNVVYTIFAPVIGYVSGIYSIAAAFVFIGLILFSYGLVSMGIKRLSLLRMK